MNYRIFLAIALVFQSLLVSADESYDFAYLDFFSAKATSSPRNYLSPVSSSDKADIAYIVNTLGMGSLTKIAKSRSQLKKAGDRVNSVHPLRFLECVFTDEEMIVSLHAMSNRGWIYSEFFSGLQDSLEEESRRNNIAVEYVSDFSRRTQTDFNLIYPEISERRWGDLVATLLQIVPRRGDASRYNQ